MDLFDILAIVLTLTAGFSYLNYRFIRLPVTIGVMVIALAGSLVLHGIDLLGYHVEAQAAGWLESIDFNKTLLHGMLSFLLFAGALHVNLNDLFNQKWAIGSLATVGILLSTFLVGTFTYWVLALIGIPLSYLTCLVFGALISPTDPIAVLGLLKNAGAPKSLEVKITGESLFNDGVGVVVFLVLAEVVAGTHEPTFGYVAGLFAQEAVGGIVFGLGLGYLAYWLLKSIDQYQVEVLITLALVTGGYALAGALHLSGPIAVVVAGLMVGNQGRVLAMSEKTREHLDTFWELIDEILNAVLFVLIGLEVLVLTFTGDYLLASAALIPLILLSRLMAIGVPIALLSRVRSFTPGAVWLMTWGGLRGGISVALALSLPAGPDRDVILAMTYVVVVFSIVVQGLTMEKLVKYLIPQNGNVAEAPLEK
ncbi:MAG: sodium:proton antiporter [Nitrospira sp. SB0672_bin_25]|nr:sodium:proton antiporter [Nitrospira sp. SB0666_bin_27]MYJ54327.1 sodium:proton antiporter [Nitrospira sp. SB0672_bin_25]